jgi:uncharacterized protein (TIGR00297 family)
VSARGGRPPWSPPGAREVGPSSEVPRTIVHIVTGGGALLLPFVRWWQAAVLAAAAVLFNVYLFRRLTRGRPDRQDAVPVGLVLYPVAILLLLLMFPMRPDIVAAAWGVLAAGFGGALLMDRRAGSPTRAWNRRRTVAGSIVFVISGAAAGAFLAWWCRPVVIPPPYLWFTIGAPAIAALAAAAVRLVPIRLDDNLSVSLTAASALWALSIVNQELAMAALAAAPAALVLALPANVIVAGLGYAAGTVTRSGAVTGAIIGTTIVVGAGWRGWLLLLTAFCCAAVTSRLGWTRKTLSGIEEERGGRRSTGNAIANTGIAAVAAVLAVVSYAHELALVAFAAALTAGASDTIASEIGKAWGRRTWSIAPFAEVPPGTPGAMSLEGTLAGLAGAAALATLASMLGLVARDTLVPIVAGATAGSLLESLLAATFEGPGILNNDALNLINTAFAAYVAVTLTAAAP